MTAPMVFAPLLSLAALLGLGREALAYPARLQSCRAWAAGEAGHMAAGNLRDGAAVGAGSAPCEVQVSGVAQANQAYTVTVNAATASLFKLYSSDGQCLGTDASPGLLATSKTFDWTAPATIAAHGISFHALCGSSFVDPLFASAPAQLCPAGGCAAPPTTTTMEAATMASGVVGTVENLELGQGLSLSFRPVDSDSVEFVVKVRRSSWLGIGLSQGSAVSMVGGGQGSDIVYCSDNEVRRRWVTSRFIQAGSGTLVPGASCTRENGQTTLTFTRPIQAANSEERSVMAGAEQQVIWAFGADGELALTNHQTRRGGNFIDFASGNIEVAETSGNAALYCHLTLMILAWGLLLPGGAAIANRTRKVPGAPQGAWFKLHLRCQIAGSCLQFLGLAAAIWFAQEYSSHLSSPHAVIGTCVCILAALQLLSGAARPHVDPSGAKSRARLVFEVVHKGLGYTAVLAGLVNIALGLALLFDREYEAAVKAVALTLAALAVLPVAAFFLLATLRPDNTISRWLTAAKQV